MLANRDMDNWKNHRVVHRKTGNNTIFHRNIYHGQSCVMVIHFQDVKKCLPNGHMLVAFQTLLVSKCPEEGAIVYDIPLQPRCLVERQDATGVSR